jgi:glycosyltransferase involved in cell wall biosynthesis
MSVLEKAPTAAGAEAPAVTIAVIPAYNEAGTIGVIASGTLRHVDQVIMVDDGSTDGTVEEVRKLPLSIAYHATNLGKAASLWNGMQHALNAGADRVITLDADGQHRPEDIPRLIAAGRANPTALIIAARTKQRGRVPKLRGFANRMADFWISWAAGCPISDTQSGFRLYPAEVLRRVHVPHGRYNSFVFESEILIEGARQGFRVVSIDIVAVYRPDARASYYRPLIDTVRIIRMVAWKLLSRGMYIHGLLRSLGIFEAVRDQRGAGGRFGGA